MSAGGLQVPGAGGDRHVVARVVVRTVLLVACIVLLFPAALDALTRGAWPRLVEAMGPWRWPAWGACFVAMTLMRFSNLPRRG